MKYWVWLSSVPYIGPVTAHCLLATFENPEAVYRAEAEDLCKVKGITRRQIRSILENKSMESARKIMEDCEKNGISILAQNDLRYPARAKGAFEIWQVRLES